MRHGGRPRGRAGKPAGLPCLERRADIKFSRLLAVFAILLFLAASIFFAVALAGGERRHVLSADEVRSMPRMKRAYRSINNWETIENTTVEGTPVNEVLARCGVDSGSATVKLIAPDGYFWPAVGTTLTLTDLRRENPRGLLPLIAWSVNGEDLDPEPDGTGLLRYISPQYSEDQVNKPSWVSNLRVIEVGPLSGGYRSPDATDVPVDEIWVCGAVPVVYPVSLYLPLSLAISGILAAAALIARRRAGGKTGGAAGPGVVTLALVITLALSLAGFPCPETSLSQPAGVYSLSELRSMPAFSGHYTFLKQLPPYTYYEADYTGVPLSYLLNQKHSLLAGASGVVVRARDGYATTLSIEQVNATYPGGLRVIIAYAKAGQPLKGEEGPVRLIVPQRTQGNRDQGGDANTPFCARMVYGLEVTPVPAGVSAPAASSVAAGSLAVYGSVAAPAPPPQPEPRPAPPPQPAGTAPEAPAGQAAPPVANAPAGRSVEDLVGGSFGGGRRLALWATGAPLSYVLPGLPGMALWCLFYLAGLP